VNINSYNGLFSDPNAGSGKLITVASLSLIGTGAHNYVLPNSTISANIGTILVRNITPSLVGPVTKSYDGTAVATLNPYNFLLTNKISTDYIYINTTIGSYSNATIASNKLVTVSGLTLAGSSLQLVDNYRLTTNTVSANVGVIYNNPTQEIPQTVLQQIIQAVIPQQITQIITPEITSTGMPFTVVPIAGPSVIVAPLPSINPSDSPNIGIFVPTNPKAPATNSSVNNVQATQYQNLQYPELGGVLRIEKTKEKDEKIESIKQQGGAIIVQ
jgi:hypothetical protein